MVSLTPTFILGHRRKDKDNRGTCGQASLTYTVLKTPERARGDKMANQPEANKSMTVEIFDTNVLV